MRELDEIPIGSPAPEERLVGYRVGAALRGLVERRALATGSFSGPLRAAAASERPVSSGAAAVLVEAGGSAGQPFALLDVTAPPPAILDVSSPSLVAAGVGVLAVASAWTGTDGDVRVQRVDAAGALLEDPAGRVIATASASNPGFGGGPWVASGGAGFLVVWSEVGRLQAVRLDASGQVVGAAQTLAGPTDFYLGPGSAVVSFDGARYLFFYQWLGAGAAQEELRALHVGTDGTVEESSPLILSDQPGTKQVLAAVFDGAQHLLVMLDGRDPVGTALTLRRLSPAAAFLDGNAATGGLVLSLAATASASLTFDGAVTFITWADGGTIRLARMTPAGALLDAEAGRPGVVAVDADLITGAALEWPIALPAGGGALELVPGNPRLARHQPLRSARRAHGALKSPRQVPVLLPGRRCPDGQEAGGSGGSRDVDFLTESCRNSRLLCSTRVPSCGRSRHANSPDSFGSVVVSPACH